MKGLHLLYRNRKWTIKTHDDNNSYSQCNIWTGMKEASLKTFSDRCRNRVRRRRGKGKYRKHRGEEGRANPTEKWDSGDWGGRRGGGGAERIPTGITSVHVFMSARRSSEAFGRNAYLLPYKNFMNTKECHRRSRHTRHRGREADVGDHRERWRLPRRCPSQLAARGKRCRALSARWCTALPTGTCHLVSAGITLTAAWLLQQRKELGELFRKLGNFNLI